MVSQRWNSSFVRSSVRWGPSIGRKYDHGLVDCIWKARVHVAKDQTGRGKPDWKALQGEDHETKCRFAEYSDMVTDRLGESEVKIEQQVEKMVGDGDTEQAIITFTLTERLQALATVMKEATGKWVPTLPKLTWRER